MMKYIIIFLMLVTSGTLTVFTSFADEREFIVKRLMEKKSEDVFIQMVVALLL